MRTRICIRALAGVVTIALWAARGDAATEPILPDFSQATFIDGAPIDNPYHPLVPGTRYIYKGVEFDDEDPDADPEPIEIRVDVTFETKVIAGVKSRKVRELEWVGGLLVEDTTDYFAQDTEGNVWYMEEETVDIEYDDEGNEISRDPGGSWVHGVNNAQATWIMSANPTVGLTHFNEFAPDDEVLDVSEILSINESITVPAGSFEDVVKINVIDVPEPEEFEHKWFAPGVGRVFVATDFQDSVPLNTLPLVSVSIIPLPPALLPGLVGLAIAMGTVGLRRLWHVAK